MGRHTRLAAQHALSIAIAIAALGHAAVRAQAPPELARASGVELADRDQDAGEAEATQLEGIVKAVEERIRVLKQTDREERKEAAEKAARKMIADAKERVRSAKRQIASKETAAGSKQERVQERALRWLDQLLGRLDRAESLL